jgi:hypothetical protein
MRAVTVLALGFALAGCERGKPKGGTEASASSPPAPSAAPTSSNITIGVDPSGGVKVEGGKALTGKPEDCAAFRACCAHPEAGLFCGLTETSEADCTKALAAVKQYLAERKATPPPGCR